jgi:hypothetical protein
LRIADLGTPNSEPRGEQRTVNGEISLDS